MSATSNDADPQRKGSSISPFHQRQRDRHWIFLADCVEKVKRGEAGINDTVKDYDDSTILHIACWSGHLEITQWAIEQKDIEINKQSKYKETPLHYAIRAIPVYPDNDKIINMLLAHPEIDLNASSADGVTPLYLAAEHNLPKLAALLRANGASTEISIIFHSGKYSAIEYLSHCWEGYNSDRLAILKILLDLRAAISVNAICSAVKKRNVPLVQLLLQYTVNIDSLGESSDGETPMTVAKKMLSNHEESLRKACEDLQKAKIKAAYKLGVSTSNDDDNGKEFLADAETWEDYYSWKDAVRWKKEAESIVLLIQDAVQKLQAEAPEQKSPSSKRNTFFPSGPQSFSDESQDAFTPGSSR